MGQLWEGLGSLWDSARDSICDIFTKKLPIYRTNGRYVIIEYSDPIVLHFVYHEFH